MSYKVAFQNLFAGLVGRWFQKPGQPRLLTFHGIQSSASSVAGGMSAESFERIVRWLHHLQYRTVTVTDWAWNQPPCAASARIVALTFDDGCASHWEVVRPILLRYGMAATFFIPTAFISDHELVEVLSASAEAQQPRFMTWAQVAGLQNQGFEVGSHGCRHLAIGSLDQREAYREIADSKRDLEQRIGRPVTSFAYPYGQKGAFSASSREMVREAGYKVACTQLGWAPGLDTDLFLLPRTNIDASDDLRRLRMKLDGAYDTWHRLRRGRLASP